MVIYCHTLFINNVLKVISLSIFRPKYINLIHVYRYIIFYRMFQQNDRRKHSWQINLTSWACSTSVKIYIFNVLDYIRKKPFDVGDHNDESRLRKLSLFQLWIWAICAFSTIHSLMTVLWNHIFLQIPHWLRNKVYNTFKLF